MGTKTHIYAGHLAFIPIPNRLDKYICVELDDGKPFGMIVYSHTVNCWYWEPNGGISSSLDKDELKSIVDFMETIPDHPT